MQLCQSSPHFASIVARSDRFLSSPIIHHSFILLLKLIAGESSL
jgi:hypothetical protein